MGINDGTTFEVYHLINAGRECLQLEPPLPQWQASSPHRQRRPPPPSLPSYGSSAGVADHSTITTDLAVAGVARPSSARSSISVAATTYAATTAGTTGLSSAAAVGVLAQCAAADFPATTTIYHAAAAPVSTTRPAPPTSSSFPTLHVGLAAAGVVGLSLAATAGGLAPCSTTGFPAATPILVTAAPWLSSSATVPTTKSTIAVAAARGVKHVVAHDAASVL
ncbi:hypothetical protein GUJ93_ZPchr0005g15774 [Zizania palustris]|uniref:Uncharacterized protein n=1 Tax=Zizania palustris TaxID=103762 RepID=A0A8J5VIF6_ZIZPA|nr:hypothetical protein GUJ93_ZPchr0005g15774 [Zizania palustris]